jgi:hypothetical protein
MKNPLRYERPSSYRVWIATYERLRTAQRWAELDDRYPAEPSPRDDTPDTPDTPDAAPPAWQASSD